MLLENTLLLFAAANCAALSLYPLANSRFAVLRRAAAVLMWSLAPAILALDVVTVKILFEYL